MEKLLVVSKILTILSYLYSKNKHTERGEDKGKTNGMKSKKVKWIQQIREG